MTNFATAIASPTLTTTTNGMVAYTHTSSALVDLFFAIGSSRNNEHITQTFMSAFVTNKELAMKCLFWARDVRGGAGERNTFRRILRVLEQTDPINLIKVVAHIPEYGRWDDLLVFCTPMVRREALTVFAQGILDGNGLAGKWAPRKGPDAVSLRDTLKMSPKQYRKTIVGLSKTVEQKMCANEWSGIEYSHVPSVAASRYQKAFMRHDELGYQKYIDELTAGSKKINASAIFPHDVVRSLRNGNSQVADAQWDALPNYVNDTKILPISDVSGSMQCPASGSISCLDVSVALGMYLASKNTGAFKDIVCTFSEKPALMQLGGSLSEKYAQLSSAEWGMSTNFAAVFNEILARAVVHNVPQSDMPEVIVCLSDMQFDQAAKSPSDTVTKMIERKYTEAGYKLPLLVFWNLNAVYGNVPATSTENGVVMVSGFSPSIMKAVLACDFENITPEAMMLATLCSERYARIVLK